MIGVDGSPATARMWRITLAFYFVFWPRPTKLY